MSVLISKPLTDLCYKWHPKMDREVKRLYLLEKNTVLHTWNSVCITFGAAFGPKCLAGAGEVCRKKCIRAIFSLGLGLVVV